MNNEYVYHMFYIDPKCQHDEEWINFIGDMMDEDVYIGLYAYTDNHELAKMFMKTRNMKRFVHIKRLIDKDEVHSLAEYFPRGYLEKVNFSTILKRGKGEIELAVTRRERAYCFSELEWKKSNMLYKTFLPSLEIFTQEIRKYLINLGYSDVLKFQNGNNMKHTFLEDSLSIFMDRFYLTMKGS